jgi:hypothetical protein
MGTNHKDLAKRTATYLQKLQQYQELQGLCAHPRFNVDRDVALYAQKQSLDKWLKEEAEDLWALGVNVYK